MQIARTKVFKKDYLRLPGPVRKAAAKQIAQLLIDHTHPSLHLEAIRGHPDLFSVRVDRRYRMSLSFIKEEKNEDEEKEEEKEEAILLRRVLDHDDLYRTP